MHSRVNRLVLDRLRAQLQASSPVLDERMQSKAESVAENAAGRELELQQLRAKMQEDMEHQVSLHKSMSEQAIACIKADFERKVCMLLEGRSGESVGFSRLQYVYNTLLISSL